MCLISLAPHPQYILSLRWKSKTDTRATFSNAYLPYSIATESRLNLLRSLKYKVNRLALEKMYISFVRPLLNYSDAVRDNASTESKKQLEAVHNEAARIITGATKLCSISNLLSDLGWESLQARRTKHKLIIFYKIINSLTPEYLQSLIPPMVQNTTSYNLRNSSDLRNIQARTNIFYNSFLPSTIRAWNELPEETKTAPSVASFKYRLNRNLHNLPPPPPPPPQNTSAAPLALVRLCMLGFERSAVLLMPTSTENIMFL